MASTSMHYSVLLSESIGALNINNGIYIDGTFGRGGHSSAILSNLNQGKLIAFDKDPEAVSYAKLSIKDPRFDIVHGPFSSMKAYCQALDIDGEVSAVLLDLGVSSPQLDQAERGFSFMKDGPLDMRMDPTTGHSVAQALQSHTDQQLADIFREYGEERHAWRIASAIKEQLERSQPIQTTLALANLIEKTIGKKEKKHPATRCFQALRIYVNEELDEVSQVLQDAFDLLKPKGRLAIISFHSLEDRLVKRFMTNLVKGDEKKLPRKLPIMQEVEKKAKWIIKQGKAGENELMENTRSRSAILRVIEKI